MSTRASNVLASFTDRFRARQQRTRPGLYVRPHSLITLAADSLRMYRDNWLPLTGIFLLPAFAVSFLFIRLDSSPEFSDALSLSLLYLKVTLLLLGPLTVATSEACLGWPMNVVRSYRRVGGTTLLRLIASVIIWLALILSGFFVVYLAYHESEWISSIPDLLQIAVVLAVALPPMLIFGARYLFVQQTIILDHCGLIDAFRRSRFLSKGYSMRNIVYFLAISGALLAIAVVVRSLLNQVEMPEGTPRWAAEIAAALLASLPSVIVTPIMGIAVVLLYYDLRVRKEHYDLEQLDQDLHA